MIKNSEEFILTLKEISVLLLQLEKLNEWMESEHEDDVYPAPYGRFSADTLASVKVKWWQLN